MADEFDDPRLKTAVKRAWGGESAPAHLQGLAARILAERAVKPEIQRDGRTFRLPSYIRWAMAAVVLIGLGITIFQYTRPIPPPTRVVAVIPPLPEIVATSMARRHDLCCMAPDHHLVVGIAGDDFAGLGRVLSGDLKIPVISTPLDHWTFDGAGPCPVWGHESAHMLYRNGSQTLSIFSMPANDFSMNTGDAVYQANAGTHHLAAFVKNSAIYCVVGNSPDGSLTADAVRQIRDWLMDAYTAVTVMGTVAEGEKPAIQTNVISTSLRQ